MDRSGMVFGGRETANTRTLIVVDLQHRRGIAMRVEDRRTTVPMEPLAGCLRRSIEMIKVQSFLVAAALLLVALCTSCAQQFTPPDVLYLLKTIKVPGHPVAFTRAGHSIRVVAVRDRARPQLWQVPPRGTHVRKGPQTLPVWASTQTVMVGDGANLWIAVSRPLDQAIKPGPGVLIKFDPVGHRVLRRTPIPDGPTTMTVIDHDLWVGIRGAAPNQGRLLRINSSTGKVAHTVRGLTFPNAIAAGPSDLWVGGISGDLWRIDPATYAVTHHSGYRQLEAITKSFMWTTGWGKVQQRDPVTAKILAHSSPLPCDPAFVIATESKAWVIGCVQVAPEHHLEPGGPRSAEVGPPMMLSAYNMKENRFTGPPIPLPLFAPLQRRPLFGFGSIWVLDANGLSKIDSSALACQVNEHCASKYEIRYRTPDRY